MDVCMTRDEALIRLLDFDMNRAQKKDLLDIIDGRMHHVLFHHKGGKPFPLSWIKVDPDNGVFIGYNYDHKVNYDIERFGDDKWKIKVNVCSVYHLPTDFNVCHVLENIKNTAFKIIGDDTYDNTYWYYAISSCYTKNEDGFVFVSMYINPVTGESNYVHICEYYPETNDLVFTNDPAQYGNTPLPEPCPEEKPIEGYLITLKDDGSAEVEDSNGNKWTVKDHANSTIYEMFHVYDDGRLETANPLINITQVRFENNEPYGGVTRYEYTKGETINDTYITAYANEYEFAYWRDGKIKLTTDIE